MKISYIKEINFLRFLSIISVVLYHYFPTILPKGYLGVDLFFVISGFLISLYIFREIQNKKFKFLNFYNRRIRRIIPAVIFLLIFVTLVSYILFTNVDLINFSKSLIYSIFFSSNFYFWIDGGYFGPNDELKPILHFWSLGVEEQFYILFPIFFYFIIKYFKKINILISVVILITLLSLFLNIFLINLGGSNPAFFLLPTRIWNFSIGVLAMLFFVKNKNEHSNLEIIFYITMLIIGFFYQIPNLPGNFIILIFTFLILRKNFPKKFFLDIFLHNRIIQYLGLISFSLYLWHWPILVFMDYYFVYDFSIIYKFLGLALAIVISILSYHYVELYYRFKIRTKSLYILIFASYIFFISFFLMINLNTKTNYTLNSPDFIAKASLTNYKCEISNYKFYKNKRGCLINDLKKTDKYELAIVGNSHAQMYVPSIKPHLEKKQIQAILLPMTGCLPTLEVNIDKNCMEVSKNYFLDYSNDKNIKTIIIATTWWHKKLYNGTKFIDDLNHEILAKSLLNLINKLQQKNKKVFLVGPIQVPLYELPQDLSRLLKFKHINENELLDKLEIKREIFDTEYETVNYILNQKLKKNYIQLHETQCDSEKCYYSNEQGVFFADGSHISRNGSKLFIKPFEIIFE